MDRLSPDNIESDETLVVDEDQMSPFEISKCLGHFAEDAALRKVINAGRGNPNFLLTTVRDAFAQLLLFATSSAEVEPGKVVGLKVRPSKIGISKKLQDWLSKRVSSRGTDFLSSAITAIKKESLIDADSVVYELVDGSQGDFYPVPSRMFPVNEKFVRRYLELVLFNNNPPLGKFNLFATEGATAAMIYIFHSLKLNHVLRAGDHVAILCPIFSPYLEIPGLKENGLIPILLHTTEENGWQLPDSELEKLKSEKVKAFFEVNPTNPSSVSISKDTVLKIAKIIKEDKPNLVVISDSVYANFVEEYHTLLTEVPQNVIGVYSFSKYYGVTGWRLGVIMLHENCVIDKIIANLPAADKKDLHERYSIITPKTELFPFIDRMVADSRSLALSHTAGLSGPQQAIMCLFALYELLDKDRSYKKSVFGILDSRWKKLFAGLQIESPDGPQLTKYYAIVNVSAIAKKRHGEDFAKWLTTHFRTREFLNRLAKEHYTICMPGSGFAAPEWTIRVSVANIDESDCELVGKNIISLLDKFAKEKEVKPIEKSSTCVSETLDKFDE